MSIDKLKEAIGLEVKKLEKKIGSLNKDIDKIQRDKVRAEDDAAEARLRKANAEKEAKVANDKATEMKGEVRALRNDKNSITNEIEKIIKDADKRKAKLITDEEEIASLKAETEKLNQSIKIKYQDVVLMNTNLNNQIKEIDDIKADLLVKDNILDEKIEKKNKILGEAIAELAEAKRVNKEAQELKVDAQVVLKECDAEKLQYASLNRGLEMKNNEKNAAIVKSQEIIKGLQERELKVKNAESINESLNKSLKDEKNRVALKEAKVSKILDTLLSDKKIKDQLKELGLK